MTKEDIIEELNDKGLIIGMPTTNESIVRIDDVAEYVMSVVKKLTIPDWDKQVKEYSFKHGSTLGG